MNDVIPHQYRRELRGLRLIAAWLNHFDAKEGNSLDAYVTEDGKSFVKHFLIDFGATLGSALHSPNSTWRGHEYDFDPGAMLTNVATLGLYLKPWEREEEIICPSIGYFESELFHPRKYKPQVPNPAFESMTDSNAFWATRIILSFTDEHIKTAVAQGKYSNPYAAEYLAKRLMERRDKIGKYWFAKMPALDDFQMDQSGKVTFCDLGIETNLFKRDSTDYRFIAQALPNEMFIFTYEEIKNAYEFDLNEVLANNPFKESEQIKISIQIKRNNTENWSQPIYLFLAAIEKNKYELIELRRTENQKDKTDSKKE